MTFRMGTSLGFSVSLSFLFLRHQKLWVDPDAFVLTFVITSEKNVVVPNFDGSPILFEVGCIGEILLGTVRQIYKTAPFRFLRPHHPPKLIVDTGPVKCTILEPVMPLPVRYRSIPMKRRHRDLRCERVAGRFLLVDLDAEAGRGGRAREAFF